MKNRDKIREELDYISQQSDGILQPEAVVEFARDEETALHGEFDWDDTHAAHQYRLWQAREIIKTVVTIIHGQTEPVEVYVSLLSDRRTPGGGYRRLTDVLADDEKRNELLQQALSELQRFREKYAQLQELSKMFKTIDKVLEKNGKHKKPQQRPPIKATVAIQPQA